MSFKLVPSIDEVVVCLKAIQKLDAVQHISKMSKALLAKTAHMSESKLRHFLVDMIEQGYVECYSTTDNPKVQRYYYVVTDKGLELLENYDAEQEEHKED